MLVRPIVRSEVSSGITGTYDGKLFSVEQFLRNPANKQTN